MVRACERTRIYGSQTSRPRRFNSHPLSGWVFRDGELPFSAFRMASSSDSAAVLPSFGSSCTPRSMSCMQSCLVVIPPNATILVMRTEYLSSRFTPIARSTTSANRSSAVFLVRRGADAGDLVASFRVTPRVRLPWDRIRVAHQRKLRSHFFGGVRINPESAGDFGRGPFRVQGGLFEKEQDGFGRRSPVHVGRRPDRSYGGRLASTVWHQIRRARLCSWRRERDSKPWLPVSSCGCRRMSS